MIVTLTANPSIDRTLILSTLERGSVHRATSVSVEPSGKGVNVARALAGNGHPAVAVLPLGGAEGAGLARLLRAERLPFVAVPVAAPIRSNITLLEAGGIATKINEPGPRFTPAEVTALLDAVLDAVRDAGPGGWTVCCGSLPPGVPADFYATVVTRVHQRGGLVAVDTTGTPLRLAAEAGADLLKPNRDELAEVSGRPLSTIGDVVGASAQLCRDGAGAVLASLGPDGAVLVGRLTRHGRSEPVTPPGRAGPVTPPGRAGPVTPPGRHPPVALHGEAGPVTLVSPVGAGDALLAGFLAGLLPVDPGRPAATDPAGAAGPARIMAGGGPDVPPARADRAADALRTALAWSAACCAEPNCEVPAVEQAAGAKVIINEHPERHRPLAPHP